MIVGGGITGAIAACTFSRAGIKVALLEAGTVGLGSTAASTALLMQEADRDFVELSARYGRRNAIAIWKALAKATVGLSRAIRLLRIDCDYASRNSIYFAPDRRGLERLLREFRARKKAGLPGRWLTATQLRRRTGLAGLGAIETRGNGQVDPIKACRGFLRASAAAGALIFEHSKAQRITQTKDGVTVRSGRGKVRAKQVIVATGYATPSFKPLVGRFRLKDTYVLASRPVSKALRKGQLPVRKMAWDTRRPYHYLRWSPDHRLLIGGADVPHRTSSGARVRIAKAAADLRDYVARVQPRLAEVPLDYAWEGLFAETPDGLPYVGPHDRYPHHLFALGYGGNGMSASYLAVHLLLRRYQTGKPDPSEKLFAFGRLVRT